MLPITQLQWAKVLRNSTCGVLSSGKERSPNPGALFIYFLHASHVMRPSIYNETSSIASLSGHSPANSTLLRSILIAVVAALPSGRRMNFSASTSGKGGDAEWQQGEGGMEIQFGGAEGDGGGGGLYLASS